MKNTYKKFFMFKYTECNALKEYLEEMALKGWLLKNINTYLTFEKAEPQKLIYSVEVFEKASIYDTRLENNAKEYVDYCSEAGWQFVCSAGKIHVFMATDENAVPIETDETLKYQTIKKSMLKQNAIQWFVLPFIVTFNPIFQYLNNFESFITNYISLFSLFALVFCYIIIGSQLISFCNWCRLARQNLANGQKLPSYNQNDFKRLNIIRMIPLVLILVAIICIGIVSFLNSDIYSGWLMFIIIGVIALTLGVSIWFQKKQLSRSVNIVFPIVLGLCASYFIMIFCLFGVIGFSHKNPTILVDGTTLSIVGKSKIPLTLEDIGISPQKYRDTDKDIQGTVFAKCTSCYDNTSNELDGEQTGISYSIFESQYDFIIDKYVKSKTSGLFNEFYKQGDTSAWGSNRVYIPVEGRYGNTVVVYDSYVFSYRSDEQLTEDIIYKIKEKLNLK